MKETPTSTSGEPWHTFSIEEAAKRLDGETKNGLDAAEAARRFQQHGPNQLEAAKARSWGAILIDQFKSLIVLLLAIATGVSFALGDHLEAISIIVVILLNSLIGFFTESRAERAIAALKKQAAPTAHVIRDGKETQIAATDVVPGDVVVLMAGARVPADGRIIETAQLQIQEAALTGESQAVNKVADALQDANLSLGDRTNMAYMGTSVTDGRGRILVTATGANTEMGRIGKLIEGAQTEDTPLEKKLAQLGRALIVIVLGLCAVIAISGFFRGHDWLQMFKVAISLAIAAVPEGLPAVATVTLAIGVQRMAKQRALIRHLEAVETLGSTTVICVDKTGTLTKNEMTVAAYELGGRRIEVTGSGYSVEGEFRDDGKKIDAAADHQLNLALRIGALCNDAKLERKEKEPVVLGDPTEAALIVAAEKAGLNIADLQQKHPRLHEIPFSSEAKRMATVHRSPENKVVAFVKGSPDTILEKSSQQLNGENVAPLSPEDRERFIGKNRELAAAALRVLALAYRELPGEQQADFDHDLIFVGLVGMIDPLREEAKESIAKCREAGMRVIMLTGDQPATAEEIARQLGVNQDAGDKSSKTVHARELEKIDAEGWANIVSESAVFARVTPEHKLRIVEALQKKNEIVAMTGDGVNDAPALKKANIGIAMGIKGTEVAKETADMIVTDDNFASIVGAVEQGRIIYRNIQRFIHYLFSCNLSEILTVFIAILIGWPLPLAALQILWLNILTDVFPALALALEPAAPGVMKQRPRNPNEKILNWRFSGLIAWQGMLLAAVTLIAFGLGLRMHGSEDAKHAGTMAFMTLALAQTFHAFNTRSQTDSMFNKRLFSNLWLWLAIILCLLLQAAAIFIPLLRRVLHTVVPSGTDWIVIGTCSFAPILVVEFVKIARRWGGQSKSSTSMTT
jgi:Ca2+-transporting ATPase